MPRKPVMFLSALALTTMGLAGCGDDSEGNGDAAESTTAVEETTTPEEPTTAEATPEGTKSEESTEETKDGDQDAPAAAADAPDPGPAPEGAVIPAQAVAKPPQTIGRFTLQDGSGPAHIYSAQQPSAMFSLDSNVLSSPYESLVEYIETDNTPAGTGSCGTNESGSSITCYQQATDGVVTLTATPEEISLEEMVVLVNQLADQTGAA